MKLGSKIGYETKRKWYGFTFILPWLIGCILFFLTPMYQSFRYAFQSLEATPTGFAATEVGFENFSSLFFKDTNFLPDLVGSLGDLIQVPLILVYSLFFAILIKGKFPGRTFMRAVAFMPVIIGSGVLMQILKEDVFASGARGGSADTYLFSAGNIPALLTSMGMGTGVVNFVTYKGTLPSMQFEDNVRIVDFQGCSLPLAYTCAGVGSDYPDYRQTLYWHPMLTLAPGESISLECKTPAYSGRFEVVAEGLTGTGEAVSASGASPCAAETDQVVPAFQRRLEKERVPLA